jgi:hypothetical protein
MVRKYLCPAVLLVPVLLLGFETTFRAQTAAAAHTVAFAELTYGANIESLARDPAGNIWFAGETYSHSLPTTAGALQPNAPAAGANGVFGRMTPSGAVTYLSDLGSPGTSSYTYLQSIAGDSAGNVYLAGYTYAADFPTTPGAFDRTCGSDGTCITNKLVSAHMMNVPTSDGFVMKLTPAADRMIYSTYVGGGDEDHVLAMAVDGHGRVHLAGTTISADFPVTAGALQASSNDGYDPDDNPLGEAFYARLSADGSALEYGTYLGGYGYDSASAIAVTASDDAFVAGSTTSPNFPTMNAVQPQNASAAYPWYYNPDAWLARFGDSGPQFSTFMGGSSGDSASAIAAFGDQVYIGGSTCSADFPGAPSGSTNCRAFITTAAASTGAVANTAFLDAGVSGFAVDQSGFLYVAGGTNSATFPTTSDAYQRAAGGGEDAVLAIFDMSGREGPALTYSTYLGGPNGESARAVIPDTAGGAFYAGDVVSPSPQTGFPSTNAQSEPPAEPVNTFPNPSYLQAWAAHVAPTQTTVQSGADIVLYARDAAVVAGNWQFTGDPAAATGLSLWDPDAGVPKIATAAASPASYFDLTFDAQAGVPYHLWLRMKAQNDSWQNDSVFVQFSDSVDANGNPLWQIGTTSASVVSLEDCSGCGEQGWGWNDNGYGVPGTPVVFATTGPHTIRIQQREDGISIDQVVLSSATWANTAPGANKNDTTIVPQTSGTSSNRPPTVSITSPSSGDTFAAPVNIFIAASASDSDGTVTKVDFYENGSLVGTANASPYSFTWKNVSAGTYSLTAVATDNQGAATTSAPITVTVSSGTTGNLPSGWDDFDVGEPGAGGSATYANGVFTVSGAGADIWGTSDAFNFAATELSGDGSIVARVTSVSDEANWVKAGVMIRGGLSDSAPHAFMLVSHAKGVAFQRRTVDGGTSVSTAGSMSTAPHWVKLVRSGDIFSGHNIISGYESADGSNWTLVGSDTFTMPISVFVGLAVSSHITGTLSTATFDSVALTQASSGGGCASVSLSQTSFYSGGPASDWSVTVTAPNDTCTWTASVDQSWLALNGVAGPIAISGTGSGKITLQTSDNGTGAFRYGTFTIGGTVYKVTQEPN